MSSDAILGIFTGICLTLALGSGLKTWEIHHVRKKGRGARDRYGDLGGFLMASIFFTALFVSFAVRLF